MRLRPSIAIAALGSMLSACNQSPVENKRSVAEVACLERSLITLGYDQAGVDERLSAMDNGIESSLGESAGIAKPDFRFLSSGHFVVSFEKVSLPSPYRSYRLRCTGDFNGGVFTSVQIDGQIYRPETGKRWAFY